MGKRMLGCDVLAEVRAAMRKLRKVERWLMQQERDERRAAVRRSERGAAAPDMPRGIDYWPEDQP